MAEGPDIFAQMLAKVAFAHSEAHDALTDHRTCMAAYALLELSSFDFPGGDVVAREDFDAH